MRHPSEPDYDLVRSYVDRALEAWSKGKPVTEQLTKLAYDELDRVWPNVHWTNWSNVLEATRHSARYAMDNIDSEQKVEEKPKKRRGRPPKSKVIDDPQEVDKSLPNAPVDESVTIE